MIYNHIPIGRVASSLQNAQEDTFLITLAGYQKVWDFMDSSIQYYCVAVETRSLLKGSKRQKNVTAL